MNRMPLPSLMTTLQRGAVAAAFVGLCAPSGSAAQPAPASDPFAAVSFLVGRWEGSSVGQPGTGTLRREYERVLGGRFIRIRNRSEYPAQAKNPKGEIHEDEGYLSFDRTRRRLMLRQFHVEGFVNQYVQDEADTPDRIVFTTEAIENIPAGWRARETYVRQGPDSFEEIFELAEAGKPFEVYSRARLRRIK
jgi:THAP4-like, heme-binding beta-barrel domain